MATKDFPASSRPARLACWNAAIWAVGNGLATTTLISYLARELGARGLAISLILAAPTIAGLLRQTAPRLIAAWGSRKSFCLSMYALSAQTLLVLPLVAAPGVLPDKQWSLVALVTLWCLYQLLEYFGTVALWSWLGDVTPTEIRGAFLGRREAWLSGGRLLGMLAGGLFAYYWPEWRSRETLWQAYALCGIAGASLMGCAIAPLARMPALETSTSKLAHTAIVWRDLFFAPLQDVRFRRLITYGCWLGAVNGLLGASQFFFGQKALGLSLLVMLAMRSQTEVGQTLVSSQVGRLVDRVGNRRVMIVSQLLVALAMVFYLTATPERWWWIYGASTLFIAYAGLNVGIPNLLLKLAPTESRNSYVASHYAWSGLAYGLGSLGGGVLYDTASRDAWTVYLGEWRLDHFAILFLAGLVLRAAGALWLARIPEDSPQAGAKDTLPKRA
jgi:MFS family permease